MIRILGHNLDEKKDIYIALTSIYGIGFSKAKEILNSLNLNIYIKVKDLTINQISRLLNFFEKTNLKLEKNLKKFNKENIKKLIEINCYRGKRHLRNLPVHGQRTRSNSRTARKGKKIVKIF